jgi:hypothetical protein
VAKKTPLLIVEQALLYEHSHQLNHLAAFSPLALRLLSCRFEIVTPPDSMVSKSCFGIIDSGKGSFL